MTQSSALEWRRFDDPPLPGIENMARDHALAESLQPGHAALRLYAWDEPTLSFGRNEPADGLYDMDRAEELGVRFVRRPTGGRAVLHDVELTYSVALPVRAIGSPRETFAAVGRALVRGLSEVGVDVDVRESSPALPPSAGPCFDVPSTGEIVVGGRKLVGSAQARIGNVFLQHGSILIEGDQSRIQTLLRGQGSRSAPPATLRSILGTAPDVDSLRSAVFSGFQVEFDGRWTDAIFGPEEAPTSDSLRARYGSHEWTWRR